MTTEAWRERIRLWSHGSDPRAMLDFAIAFDARPVAGNAALLEAIRPAFDEAARNDIVLHHFARAAIEFHTPLTASAVPLEAPLPLGAATGRQTTVSPAC